MPLSCPAQVMRSKEVTSQHCDGRYNLYFHPQTTHAASAAKAGSLSLTSFTRSGLVTVRTGKSQT